jgi:arginine decarboxylase
MVAVFGMAEDVAASGGRLVAALREELSSVPEPDNRLREAFAPPPPWGELVMTPRDAFLGPQQIVPAADAVGRVAAESLAAYPPGIPNVLPGERLTSETLDYVRQALEAGGSLRGASDRQLRTIRAVVES